MPAVTSPTCQDGGRSRRLLRLVSLVQNSNNYPALTDQGWPELFSDAIDMIPKHSIGNGDLDVVADLLI